MTALAGRYDRIVAFFNNAIRYRCPNTASFTILGCAGGPCSADSDAESCPGARQIALCNGFWTLGNDQQRANVLFHEAFHAHLRIGGHPVATARRLNNPECNAGFMRRLFNIGGMGAPQCPTP